MSFIKHCCQDLEYGVQGSAKWQIWVGSNRCFGKKKICSVILLQSSWVHVKPYSTGYCLQYSLTQRSLNWTISLCLGVCVCLCVWDYIIQCNSVYYHFNLKISSKSLSLTVTEYWESVGHLKVDSKSMPAEALSLSFTRIVWRSFYPHCSC